MSPKENWEKYDKQAEDKEEEKIVGDIALLKTYGQGPYAKELKKIDSDIKDVQKRINEKIGVKESDTGLAPPNLWDIPADKQRMQEEQPLQVARCTKIIEAGEGEEAKYIINVKQIAKFVVALGERVSPTDIEEGMRVGVDRNKYQIQIPLPPKIDPSVTMMQVEEKPDVTYSDVGGCKEQIEKLREVVELPLLQPERFVNLGIDPPKGVLLYGPPGTGKTLCARAVANRTDATFIRVIGSELVQKYVGEGARMVRELFEMARTKKACIIFFDEIDAIGDDKQAEDKEEEKIVGDIALLKTYGQGPYAKELKKIDSDIKDVQKRINEKIGVKESDTGLAPPNLWRHGQGPYAKELKKIDSDIKDVQKRINEKIGVKESDTGLAPPNLWDIPADKQRMQEEQPLQVARCTKIIEAGEGEEAKYIINVKQIAKFVVALGERVSPTDIEEGMRVGVDRNKYQIQIPLPPKIDPSVTMMQVEEKPDVTYSDVGGCKEQIEKLREVVELPLLQPERFVNLGIDPPKGVLLYGPPGTGKTLCARAVANRTDATFIRVIGSELVQKYVGEGARMVRELFEMARTKKACIIFFDEIDAIGGARYDDGAGGDNEVQRTMLELINQLDGFDPRGNIKILMATNRPDTLDPALLRPGRLDRKVEFSLPDLEGRTHILKIHAKSMSVERDIRYELIARLCPNSTEAGMFAIRSRRKVASEKDFLESVNKVIKSYAKFSSTPSEKDEKSFYINDNYFKINRL
ncbi:1999_t:CDS:10 [Entrophospora sp. SA101]|nr:1999_t:CDS:10 [Entrophospora sp. SA101]